MPSTVDCPIKSSMLVYRNVLSEKRWLKYRSTSVTIYFKLAMWCRRIFPLLQSTGTSNAFSYHSAVRQFGVFSDAKIEHVYQAC
jgi:hypothetical protein